METLNLPFFKAKVRSEYLHDLESGHGEYEDCYVVAVTVLLNRPLLFHVHTTKGALYSKLPLEAICHLKCDKKEIHEWGALGNKAGILEISYFRNYNVKTKHGIGRYMFSIDFFDGGFSEDPEQQKILHFIELDSGHYTTASNNECLFLDAHFTTGGAINYKRNTHYWRGSE